MKVLTNILLTAASAITLNLSGLYGQVSAFSATLTQQESMLVSWTMKAGITCIDLELEHAGSDMQFRPIYLHNGVCGSTDKEESYYFEQNDGLENTNFYRIKLGFIGYSDTIRIDAPLLGTNGIIVSPQPASTSVQFQFNNPKADNYSLYIYSLTGKLIHLESKITSNQYRIDSSNFPAGYYVYLLRSDYKTHQGKISITQ
jgi:hypothetical protein